MGEHEHTTRNRLFMMLALAACVAAPAIHAVPRQAAGNQTTAAPAVTVLRFGKLWDGRKVMTDAVVVVEGERVKSVGTGNTAVPPGAKVVDLSKY